MYRLKLYYIFTIVFSSLLVKLLIKRKLSLFEKTLEKSLIIQKDETKEIHVQ